ncbi:MAG: prepilin-type N-terminal cleavage/methylation domain-containing protein [Nitrospirae bacterium]|nr:prepilin-type N-terminal cleavage/methylation domain-containing protein [Nitrospirota bacterium]
MAVSRNKRLTQSGVTLVEVMIAMVIMLIVFMGLIQASLLSIENNLSNEIRDEATRIGSEYMAATRSTAWENVANLSWPTVTRNFRSRQQSYSVSRWTTIPGNTNIKQVEISVVYADRNAWSTIMFRSILRQAQ